MSYFHIIGLNNCSSEEGLKIHHSKRKQERKKIILNEDATLFLRELKLTGIFLYLESKQEPGHF